MASKRRIRRRSCEGKVRHESEGAALGAIRSLYRAPKLRGGKTLGVYKCQFCGGYHVGHKPKGKFSRNDAKAQRRQA